MSQTHPDTSDLSGFAPTPRATHRPVGDEGGRTCDACGPTTQWPCPTATWQEQWLATLNLEPEQLP